MMWNFHFIRGRIESHIFKLKKGKKKEKEKKKKGIV